MSIPYYITPCEYEDKEPQQRVILTFTGMKQGECASNPPTQEDHEIVWCEACRAHHMRLRAQEA